tara:strand:- start:462 stop:710 length:249 start_codon:yes stop_codon:yes gene_type:complete
MIPCDTDNIKKEYEILIRELEKHNPELLDKQRLLAITKSDLLDDELEKEMSREVPDIPHVFISSVSQKGLVELKDMIWRSLN